MEEEGQEERSRRRGVDSQEGRGLLGRRVLELVAHEAKGHGDRLMN